MATIKNKKIEHLEEVHSYDVDLNKNHIYLIGHEEYANEETQAEPGVEYLMANRFIKNMNLIMHKNTNPILIHMKTCGGFWEEGMAIYDIIKSCPNQVCILNYTHARSMSSLIFQAADKRVMMPHSTFMFHDGTMEMYGTVKQFHTEVELLKKTEEIMLNIYIDSMKAKGKMKNFPRQKLRQWLRSQMDKKEDVHLSAQEAVDYGFADEIFGADGVYDWDSLLKFE